MEKIINVYDRNRRTCSFRLVDAWYESQKWWHCLTPGIVLFSDSRVGSDIYFNAGHDIVCYLKYRVPDMRDWAEAEYKAFLRFKNVRLDRGSSLITQFSGDAEWLLSPGLTTFALPGPLRWEAIS